MKCLASLWWGSMTNFAMVPVMAKAWNNGMVMEATIGLFAMISSVLYHYLEAAQGSLMGFDAGRFHVADNVFANSLCCMALIALLQLPNILVDEALKTSAMCLAIVAQCLKPWDIRFTLIPIVGFAVFVFLCLIAQRRRPIIKLRHGLLSLTMLLPALYFFYKGLNDDNDECKVYHGCWHLCFSVAMFCYLEAIGPRRGATKEREIALHGKLGVHLSDLVVPSGLDR